MTIFLLPMRRSQPFYPAHLRQYFLDIGLVALVGAGGPGSSMTSWLGKPRDFVDRAPVTVPDGVSR